MFGGLCVGGLPLGCFIQANPENWTIVDDRLYLNYSRRARDILRSNPSRVIGAAEANARVLGHRPAGE